MITLNQTVRLKSIYIGDGAYFYDDGFYIWIFTTDGISIQNQVALDPSVVTNLLTRLEDYQRENHTS